MRRLLALASLPLLMGLAPVQKDLPVRYADTLACGPVRGRPSLAHLWASSDLAVHVRIDAQRPFGQEESRTVVRSSNFDAPETQVYRTVYTKHEATVLKLLKEHPNGVGEGGSERFIQWGGAIRHDDHILIHRMNHFDILPVGTEWVLFLKWNPDFGAFTLGGQEHALPVRNGKIGLYPGPWFNDR